MLSRFDLVNSVAEEAIDLAAPERPAFLASRCGLDRELLASVERLLAISDTADGFLDAPSDGGEIRPGDVLGNRFRILEELGAGGMCAVYLAEDRQLGEVALKIPHPELRGAPGAIERLAAEIRAVRAVHHPNVCPVYDLLFFETPRGPIAAATMPRLCGETLAARLTRGPIAPDQAMLIAGGIAAGIDALHRAGIVHRDLKPGNILLTPGPDGADVPVLIDFGLAGPPGAEASAAPISGSPDYMAPEQFRGTPAGPEADIYAFGLILFEMLAGARPFPAEELLPAVVRRTTEDAPSLCAASPWIPRVWDAPIARALSRAAAHRPSLAMELIAEVRRDWAEAEVRRIGVVSCCAHPPAPKRPQAEAYARPGILVRHSRNSRSRRFHNGGQRRK
jgi:serine/threonine protein kinase